MDRIALNVAISFVRSNSVRERRTVALDEPYDMEDASAAPLEDDERARVLRAFIARLDELNRALLLLVVFGIDLVDPASRASLAANLLVGAAGIAGTLWWYRRLWIEPADSERRRSVEESASGKSFADAQRFLDELACFERE